MHIIEHSRGTGKLLTYREAVEKCSLTTEEQLANLFKMLIDKRVLAPTDLEVIFEHEFSVEND